MAPIMLDLNGFELTAEEREILQHPLVGGIILFTRNFHDHEQLRELVRSCREAARQPLLLAVDHEGGRVQRFRDGFSAIPAMGDFAKKYAANDKRAEQSAELCGWLMASEVRAFDIDISFAPVLDIHGISEVIGDRSFSADSQQIVQLASAFIRGMRRAGMLATGKHFPGHGNVLEDSHIAMPVDKRDKAAIFATDMQIFKDIHKQGLLDAVMPAHVIYPEVDSLPAGFSKVWVTEVLRQALQFDGVVFSDDLAMAGATCVGSFVERAAAAFAAGCDMALVCNHRQGAIEVLDGLSQDYINDIATQRLARMSIGQDTDKHAWASLQASSQWQQAQSELARFKDLPELAI